jgi:hypothetical protein
MRSILPLTKRPSPSSRPRCSAVAAERDLEAPRQHGRVGARLLAGEPLEVAPEALAELRGVDLAELEPNTAAQCLVDAALEEPERGVEVAGVDPLAAELLRQPAVERIKRLVGNLAAHERVGLGVDRLRVDDALEEPGRGAVDEALELGCPEHRPLAEPGEDGGVSQPGVAIESSVSALESARPAVRVGEREREVGLLGFG